MIPNLLTSGERQPGWPRLRRHGRGVGVRTPERGRHAPPAGEGADADVGKLATRFVACRCGRLEVGVSEQQGKSALPADTMVRATAFLGYWAAAASG